MGTVPRFPRGFPGPWGASITQDIEVSSLDRFGIRYGNSADAWIDEIRIGDSYGSVIPEPASVGLVCLFGAVALLRKRLMRK